MRNKKKNFRSVAGGFTAVLFLLIMIVIIPGCSSDKPDEESPAPESIESPAPDEINSPEPEEIASPEPTPSEIPSPEPSEEPSPEPEPEPVPEPEPTTEPETIASGSFVSDTETGLNLVADWSAVNSGDGQVIVTVKLSTQSYTLHVKSMPGGAAIRINDQSFTVTTKAVDCDSESALAKTEIASAQTILPLGPDGAFDADVSAVWYFKGTYSEKEFESIEASGIISNQ